MMPFESHVLMHKITAQANPTRLSVVSGHGQRSQRALVSGRDSGYLVRVPPLATNK